MSDKQDRQIVDIHSHIFWYPDHLSLELVSEALAAKKVKIGIAARPIILSQTLSKKNKPRWSITIAIIAMNLNKS